MRARFDVGDASHPVSIEASEEVEPQSDSFVPLGLLPAMTLGVPLRIGGGVSPRLLERTSDIQAILRLWHEGARTTTVEADARADDTPTGTGVGVLFGGGVDSFYTLLERRDEITDLIFIVGIDIPLSAPEALQQKASHMAGEVARALDKRLIEVRADLRSFSKHYADLFLHYGSMLAAVALLFQHRLRRVLVPEGLNYAMLNPDGSHPLLDPLWSTGRTEIIPHGEGVLRTEKVESIASSELAMRWLRVCLTNTDGAYNCGRCEKCVRTLVALRAVGAEGRCQTLPRSLSPAQVRRVRFTTAHHPEFALDNLRAVEARGDAPQLARSLRLGIAKEHLREAVRVALPPRLLGRIRAKRARLGRRLPP